MIGAIMNVMMKDGMMNVMKNVIMNVTTTLNVL
jgi:hypothetical protein